MKPDPGRTATHNWGRSVDDTNRPTAMPTSGNCAQARLAVRGAHRSYSDDAVCPGGVVVSSRDRTIRIGADGIVTVGAAVTLDQLDRFAAAHDLNVDVVPGTFQVTVGGAVAGDVHGKNHPQAGSFHTLVHAVHLVTFDGTGHRIDRHHPWFPAVSAGMGLTGVIERAELSLGTPHRGRAAVRTIVDRDLAAGMERLMRSGDSHEYLRICPRTRRVLVAEATLHTGERRPARRLELPGRHPKLSDRIVRRIEALHIGMLAHAAPHTERLVCARDYLAPLDRFGRWDHHVGPRGFRQYQYALPHDDAVAEMARVALDHDGYFLTVRRLGAAGPGWLSFARPGWALSVDHQGDPHLGTLLDRIAIKTGGRCNLTKNLDTPRETLETMYPDITKLRTLLETIDPHGWAASGLARRLGLR